MLSPGTSVVIDTNVWISGLISVDGPPGQLTRQVIRNAQPVFSASTFAELKARLWLPKFDRYVSTQQRNALLGDLSNVAQWVKIPPALSATTHSRDSDDDKFIHAALATQPLASQPAWLITGDKDLLVLAAAMVPLGVRILNPADAASCLR